MRRRAISLALLGRLEKLLRELDGFLEVLGDRLDFVRCILVASLQQRAALEGITDNLWMAAIGCVHTRVGQVHTNLASGRLGRGNF